MQAFDVHRRETAYGFPTGGAMTRRLALTVLSLAMLTAGCVSFSTPSAAPDYQIPHQLTPGGAANPTASDAAAQG